MPLRKILLLIIVLSTMVQTTAYSEIRCISWQDLSNRTISPVGKAALLVDGELWKHTESQHFIYHFTDEKEAEVIYSYAEMYYDWIKNFFGIKGDGRVKKNHVFIFADRGEWSKFLAKIGHREEPGAFTNGWELFSYRGYAKFGSMSSLAHELTHIIVFKFMDGPLPLFLNEGFATFATYCLMSTQVERSGGRMLPIPFLSESEYIPLGKISSMNSYPEGKTVIFYRESDWFIRFLALTYGRARCYEFLRSVSKNRDFKRSLKDTYNMDLPAVEEKFKAYAVYK